MLIEFILGCVVGLVMALTGAGGGILAVPLLVFGIGLDMVRAAPIGLLAVGLGAALGAVLGLRSSIVRYKAASLMAAAGVGLAPVGVWLAGRVDNRWLTLLFAGVLLFVAYRTIKQAHEDRLGFGQAESDAPPCQVNRATRRFVWTTRCAKTLAAAGALAGLLSGLLGVGGGFVMVPALKRYSDLTLPAIASTSLAVIALVSITGVASSAWSAQLDWSAAMPFSGGSLAGMLFGRLIASRLSGPRLQLGFGLVSAVVAIGLIVKTLAA